MCGFIRCTEREREIVVGSLVREEELGQLEYAALSNV